MMPTPSPTRQSAPSALLGVRLVPNARPRDCSDCRQFRIVATQAQITREVLSSCYRLCSHRSPPPSHWCESICCAQPHLEFSAHAQRSECTTAVQCAKCSSPDEKSRQASTAPICALRSGSRRSALHHGELARCVRSASSPLYSCGEVEPSGNTTVVQP